MALSPMMKQYMDIKENYEDCILFFRLGDFYEMFFEDAITAAREIELTLTGRNCGLEERAPMCGVPFHSSETYISRLVEKGYKVAICEQMEETPSEKGIVKRDVVQVITPGTITSGTMLKEKDNNYLASLFVEEEAVGFSYCDITTGEINATEFKGADAYETLVNELIRIDAKELIINDDADNHIDVEKLGEIAQVYTTKLKKDYYELEKTEDSILNQFKTKSLLGIGLYEMTFGQRALGAQLLYLYESQKKSMDQVIHLNVYNLSHYMALDKSTIKNLELTETLFEKRLQGSLLGILDKTNTAMGGRKMKKWIKEPLNRLNEIENRLNGVEFLIENYLLRNNIKENLKLIYDFERLIGKIATGSANGKDLVALKQSLFVLPEIKLELEDSNSLIIATIEQGIDPLKDVFELIDISISDDPPFTIKEGGLIKEGYSEELDQLKHSIKDAQDWIAQLEFNERERTGIKNLKVGFNKVFGYYIEITKSNYDLTPDNYVRKQTLANCERFITPELKEMESLVLNAEVKINKLEYDLFLEIRESLKACIERIQATASSISTLDVLCSFADVSEKNDYIKPKVNETKEIVIKNGRHPVIEQSIRDGIFVPNDTYLNGENSSFLLITGPNMAGKSTYMRQTAIIVLMAQIGCYVPCDKCEIGIVDRIFTRIGASDNLAQGQSTFFVEMSELAYILNSATDRSLVILDEIGRGTSTYDGLSIAWAAVEYLCDKKHKSRSLFASHYHELTVLEGKLKGFKNLNVDVAEKDGNIVFLHKIVEGSASRSYGIHVAKLAGVPEELLTNATAKLEELEASKEKAQEEVQIQFNF